MSKSNVVSCREGSGRVPEWKHTQEPRARRVGKLVTRRGVSGAAAVKRGRPREQSGFSLKRWLRAEGTLVIKSEMIDKSLESLNCREV